MKSVRFLSRFTLICNVCFVLFVIFNWLESSQPPAGRPGTVESIPFFKEIIIILGFPAIIINLIMCLTYLILIIAGKKVMVPKWLSLINLAFLLGQFVYYFI